MGKQPEFTPEMPNPKVYDRVRSLLETIFNSLDIRVENKQSLENFASQGGGIIAPTHSSWLDIPVLGAVNDQQRMRFMGKKEAWSIPLVKNLANAAGAYPVVRSDASSRAEAINNSLTLLDSGQSIVIYPEGTRYKGSEPTQIGKVRTGVARIALSAEGETLILPVGIGYNHGRVFNSKLRNVGVVFGDVIEFPEVEPDSHADLVRTFTDDIAFELESVKKAAIELAHA